MEFEVVFEPMPPKVREYRKSRIDWETRLAPVKAAPGAQARILRCDTKTQKDYFIRTIRLYQSKYAPLEKWEFEGARMQDSRGGYGVWACYRGTYTEKEIEAREIARKIHSDRMKMVYARKKIREQVKAGQMPTVRPYPGAR
jgi:hypothetical protein